MGTDQTRDADPLAGTVGAAVTSILYGFKEAVVLQPVASTLLAMGVPKISPVLELTVVQFGKPLAEKVVILTVAEGVGWNTQGFTGDDGDGGVSDGLFVGPKFPWLSAGRTNSSTSWQCRSTGRY